MKPKWKLPGTKRLKLKCDVLLSNIAFKFNLRRYNLDNVLDRDVKALSGGELQRFAIAVVCVQNADIYMFDEPSSYLDVKQRLKASRVIRSLLQIEKYVIVVEHDLSVLDYLSDFICCLYGKPAGAYTRPQLERIFWDRRCA